MEHKFTEDYIFKGSNSEYNNNKVNKTAHLFPLNLIQDPRIKKLIHIIQQLHKVLESGMFFSAFVFAQAVFWPEVLLKDRCLNLGPVSEIKGKDVGVCCFFGGGLFFFFFVFSPVVAGLLIA